MGGYCTEAVGECNSGKACWELMDAGIGPSCEAYWGGFQDIDGQPLPSNEEICPVPCQTSADCRTGYQCCFSNVWVARLSCLPSSLCGQ